MFAGAVHRGNTGHLTLTEEGTFIFLRTGHFAFSKDPFSLTAEDLLRKDSSLVIHNSRDPEK